MTFTDVIIQATIVLVGLMAYAMGDLSEISILGYILKIFGVFVIFGVAIVNVGRRI